VSTSAQAPAPPRDAIEGWLIDWIAKELGMAPAEIETSKSLLDYSLSSVTAMMLVGDLEEWLGLTLPPTLVWDYPSIAAIADYLVEQAGSPSADVAAGTEPVIGREMAGDRNGQPGSGADLYASLDRMSDEEVDALLSRMMADQNAGASS
jgi:acyl carrier protein